MTLSNVLLCKMIYILTDFSIMLKKTIFVYTFSILYCCCYMLNFLITAVPANCSNFFSGQVWPRPNNAISSVKLCQTQRSDKFQTVYYATLFDTVLKTPLYSANIVTLNNKTNNKNPRTKNVYWKRVATGLCGNNPPHDAIYSEIAFVSKPQMCENLQAVDDDYTQKHSKFQVKDYSPKQCRWIPQRWTFERGHLTPSSINRHKPAKERATFTLTNAAPQVKEFNKRWYKCELFVENFIRKYAPGEVVYIMTGVYGSKTLGNQNWKLNKRVTVPYYFWKAVCYPGCNGQPFGFAFMRSNAIDPKSNEYQSFMTLNEFAAIVFNNNPRLFKNECMNVQYTKMENMLHSMNFTF